MKLKTWSIQLIRFSMFFYVLWLMLPAVQTTGRAMTGAACVGLFGLGVVLDTETLKKEWLRLGLRALCAAGLPLLLRRFLERGGTNFAGFYVQQAMFWFPLVFAGHVRTLGDKRLTRQLKWVLLGAVVVTLLTTCFWLIEGMLRGGRVYAYSRSLGYAGEGREAYLKELMLKNIGGYDFIYAMVAALPLTCIAIEQSRGKQRGAFLALIALQTAVIVLSQYTYAMLYAAAILAVEMLALIIRRLSKSRISVGRSLLLGAIPLVLALVFVQPLIQLAAYVCAQLGLTNFAFSFEQLLLALQGGATSADSRLSYYLTALEGIRHSPLIGSMLSGETLLSYHSDLLDLLSGMGVVGAVLIGGMIWLMGRGSLRGLKNHPHKAQLSMMYAAIGVTALLGTVVYSRDIMLIAALGALCVMENYSA